MKSSFATNGQLFMMIFIVLLVFVTSSATRLSRPPLSSAMPEASPTTSLHHRHHLPHHDSQRHPCDALTRDISRSLCIHLQTIYQHPLPVLVPILSPPLPIHHEIDPRYGVEKRLVPSGPNPLHN